VALLLALPTSRLLIATVSEGLTRKHLTEQFQALGISVNRLSFCDRLPRHEFQRMLQQVDITLDPFPVNGATTTCESLWLGVPVLALAGNRFLSRAGLSILSAAYMSEFVASTSDEFLGKAISLAGNLPLLAELRAELREKLSKSPLLDQQRFTLNLENLYHTSWKKWCEEGDSTEFLAKSMKRKNT
jgi:predicted O-linked N-acetylglucosamine transferase (SPINDLY family)